MKFLYLIFIVIGSMVFLGGVIRAFKYFSGHPVEYDIGFAIATIIGLMMAVYGIKGMKK